MAKVSNVEMKKYPDISRQLAAKESRRRELARLPVSEKLHIVGKMVAAHRSIKTAVKGKR